MHTALRLTTLAIVATAGVSCSRSSSTSPTPATSAMAVASGLPSAITPATIALGDSLYHARACTRCHGPKGVGGQNGPALNDATWLHITGDYDSIVGLVTSGVPQDRIKDASHRFNTQPRGGTANPLSDEQISAVAAYVYTISHVH